MISVLRSDSAAELWAGQMTVLLLWSVLGPVFLIKCILEKGGQDGEKFGKESRWYSSQLITYYVLQTLLQLDVVQHFTKK